MSLVFPRATNSLLNIEFITAFCSQLGDDDDDDDNNAFQDEDCERVKSINLQEFDIMISSAIKKKRQSSTES